jgi:predicted acylesterase/phospholipase RssA
MGVSRLSILPPGRTLRVSRSFAVVSKASSCCIRTDCLVPLGGSYDGLYHFGVVSALLKEGILPHIISGTRAGSVVAAIVCTRRDDELRRDLTPEVLDGRACCFRRPWKGRSKGFDWMDLIQWFTRGPTTFLEVYRRTGRVFFITLSSTTKKAPPVLLNYLTAPNITVASAVIAR